MKAQAAQVEAKSDYPGGILVNVARVPRIVGGAWAKSPKGSLLLDTLCFPVTMSVAVGKKSKDDHKVWTVILDGKEMPASDARKLSIGDSVLTDTTTGKRYLVRHANGDDALPQASKSAILRKTRRRTTIQRLKVVRKLLASVIQIPNIGGVWDDAERAELYNSIASDTLALKDALYKVSAKKEVEYFSLKA